MTENRAVRPMRQTLSQDNTALPSITWTADAQGNIDTIGAAWAAADEQRFSQALGDGWLAFIHPSQREEVMQKWKESVAEGKPYDARYKSCLANGSYRWVVTHARPGWDSSKRIVNWVGMNIDIEEESQEIENQYIFKSLAQHANDCVIIFAMDYSVRFSNMSARRLLNVATDEELYNISFIDLFVSDDQIRVYNELIPEIEMIGRWKGEFRVRNFRSNEAIPAQYDIFTIYDNNQRAIGISVIIRDLLDRLRYEQGFRMLAAAGAALLDTLEYRTILRNIARVIVTGFSPCCVIDEIDEHGNLRRLALAHVDPVRETLLQQASASLSRLPNDHIIMRTLTHGQAQIDVQESASSLMSFTIDDIVEPIHKQVFDSIISVPIVSIDGRVLAALTCGSSVEELGRRLNRDDLHFLQELSYRATAAIENSRRYEHERHIALTLQEAALPRALRRHSGLQVSAEYRPGRTEATIGGDWYDTLALEDGRFLCIVGDVVGNGLRAAVAMSKLRQAMQTAALINPNPNFILDAADQILRLHNENMYATALVCIYDPQTHSTTFASAGHHDPIIVNRDRQIRIIECRGMMIGLRTPGTERTTAIVTHEAADMIVLYTDGIIEAERNAEVGMKHLLAALTEDHVLIANNAAEALVNTILRGERATDDLAILTLRIDAIEVDTGLRMSYNDVTLANGARQVFSRYLLSHATPESDMMSAELIFGELLGNVSRHAPGPVDIVFTWKDGEAILQMIDYGKGYSAEHASLPTEFSESRRGLFLIKSFSKTFTVEHVHRRTISTVTFENLFAQ